MGGNYFLLVIIVIVELLPLISFGNQHGPSVMSYNSTKGVVDVVVVFGSGGGD